MTVRDEALAALAAVCSTGVLMLVGPLGVDPALPGVVFAAAVVAVAWHVGLRAASLCGPLCAERRRTVPRSGDAVAVR